jgi:hypothetical protein
MEFFTGIVRALLASVAGGLVLSGKIDSSQADTLVGAGGILVTMAWSAAAKSKRFPRIK